MRNITILILDYILGENRCIHLKSLLCCRYKNVCIIIFTMIKYKSGILYFFYFYIMKSRCFFKQTQ